MANNIFIYDTTLRDGTQRENVSFSVTDKLLVTEELDRLGVAYIEGGMPGSNPKDTDYFKKVAKLKLKNSKLVAFGATRRKNTKAAKDPNLLALIDCCASVACIVGKSWDIHVTSALKTTLAENLKMIKESVKFLKSKGLEVHYDAEHFFDAYKTNPKYAMQTIQAAADGGADWIVLCDTNGGSLPDEVGVIVKTVTENIDTPVGMHAHNDSNCAVANTVMAVINGATQVQGTINGYGERCGNADLCSIIPNLQIKKEYKCLKKDQLKLLTEVSHFVSELANINPDPHQPYVGGSAFAHKAGLHVSAIAKNPDTYQHIVPELVGNIQRVLLSELSGKSTIVLKAKELGVDLSKEPEEVETILKKIKKLEHVGYHFEASDGSFEILMKKTLGSYKPFFKLESFRVLMEKREDGQVMTEATIKIHCKGKRLVSTAEGNGPVNALDLAIRDAIGRVYPELSSIGLTDYKVRVLDEKKGTGAVVRVLIESTDGKKTWGTIGVNENIIQASWEALVDSVEYGLSHKVK
ncbi:MAG: citramalate synthase [Actinobacteria bacterium]|nr:MAG: citramalate synthase [Actinomycetota bacterium]